MVNELIHKYCSGNEPLEQVLLRHSSDVAQRALKIARMHPELGADETFLCGILGAEILRSEGLPRHARVAERHTGTGLTASEITKQGLPLPPRDFTPESIEEQIVCYADKFYSKTCLDAEKTPEQALRTLEKFGSEGLAVFRAWMERFE